ncbi:uncharacterized protein [Nicotiana sylvestris]|uniref:uncharacterized protein n=1 Tax=Nicotiana sylvestris TaxID=4096 RepID=UPI00388C7DA3
MHLLVILVLRGSLQSPSPTPGSCYECGELGHMRRQCPRRLGGSSQQSSQPSTLALVTSPSPTQPARGGGQSSRGRPRGGGQSGGGQARFYALLARLDVIASDAVFTGHSAHFYSIVSYGSSGVEEVKGAASGTP